MAFPVRTMDPGLAVLSGAGSVIPRQKLPLLWEEPWSSTVVPPLLF